MKRKGEGLLSTFDEPSQPSEKRIRVDESEPTITSPRKRAFSRICKFELNERIIGFYGGWPFIGTVADIKPVRMSFGATYLLQVRWIGFSGKKGVSWISEFDVVKHDESNLKLKSDMEVAQRDLIQEAGRKCDKIMHRKIFLRVVEEFRGKRLAPAASRLAPYAEQWQQIIRLSAVPKLIMTHLLNSEAAVHENKLVLLDNELKSAHDVMTEWAGSDPNRAKYLSVMSELFASFLFKTLLYKPELLMASQRVVNVPESFLTVFPAEYVVRLCTLIPDILTATGREIFGKSGERELLESLIDFVDCHQAFLAHLEINIDSILRTPVRQSLVDDALPEWTFFGSAGAPDSAAGEYRQESSCNIKANRIKRSKRKYRVPLFKGLETEVV